MHPAIIILDASVRYAMMSFATAWRGPRPVLAAVAAKKAAATHIHIHIHIHLHLSLSIYIYIYVYVYTYVFMHIAPFSSPKTPRGAKSRRGSRYGLWETKEASGLLQALEAEPERRGGGRNLIIITFTITITITIAITIIITIAITIDYCGLLFQRLNTANVVCINVDTHTHIRN